MKNKDLHKQLQVAIEISTEAHFKKLNEDGESRIIHPLRLMNSINDMEAQVVAILHDILEDYTLVREDDLRRKGIDEKYIQSIRLLTRDESKSYKDYIKDISKDYFATIVKIEDLKYKMDLCRLKRTPTTKDYDRAMRDMHAFRYLIEVAHKYESENIK